MTGPEIRDNDTLGGKLLIGVLVAVLIGALLLVVSGPEPCTDQTTTVCAS